jgi:hypothetical protein
MLDSKWFTYEVVHTLSMGQTSIILTFLRKVLGSYVLPVPYDGDDQTWIERVIIVKCRACNFLRGPLNSPVRPQHASVIGSYLP